MAAYERIVAIEPFDEAGLEPAFGGRAGGRCRRDAGALS
jgi:hypothetical protein